MAVDGSNSSCGPNACTQPLLKHKQKTTQRQNRVLKSVDNLHLKPQMVKVSSGSKQILKYWLAASFCLNALMLSVLLSRMASVTEQLAEVGRGSYVNGGWDTHGGLQNQRCSGQGHYEYDGVNGGRCRCYSCFTGSNCSEVMDDCTINFDHGDPKMFESFWTSNQNAFSMLLLGGDRMSYFSYTDAICWFLEPSLASEIRLMHKLVGNAVTDGYHIIVGTGSSQLISAAIYALSLSSHSRPVDVVSAAPFYSSYPPMTDFLKSQLHKWVGDAWSYKVHPENMYIELVTSPGNPDGIPHSAIVNGSGSVIYDLAYYWPHYTPIASPADYGIMLFTVSKSTGHAGTRIGWALVQDADIAKKMTKFIELSTIGVSKDAQFRASQILKAIRSSYSYTVSQGDDHHGLFEFGHQQMKSRWDQLREVVSKNGCFSVETFPVGHCKFFGKETASHPAFAWLHCDKDEDCAEVFKANGVLTRSGVYFGSSPRYVRISMVDHDKVFQLFISRLHRMVKSCGNSWRA